MLGTLRSLLSFSREEGRGRSIRSDERGQFGEILFPVIVGIAGLFGIGCAASIDWHFLLATLVIIVIGLAVAGAVFFGVPFKYVLIVAILCLGIVVFLQIGALVAMGLLIVGGVFYWRPAFLTRNAWMFVAMIGLGVLLAIWGVESGTAASIAKGLQTVVP